MRETLLSRKPMHKILLLLFLFSPIFLFGTILEDITNEIGIEQMSSKLENQKSEAENNRKRIDALTKRLETLDTKMQSVLNRLNSKKEKKQQKAKPIKVKTSSNSVEENNQIVYTLQIYSSYSKESALLFFNTLPQFMQENMRLYSIGKFYVLRYGKEEIRSNLSIAKKKIVELGIKDVFSVKTSLATYNSAEAL